MALEDFIRTLEKAERGARPLDSTIAKAMGWKTNVEHIRHAENAESVRKVTWYTPDGDERLVPNFTTSIDDALLLLSMIGATGSGGVSWVDGRGTAVIEDGPYCEAATPALALCIAAMKAKQKRNGGRE